MFSYIDLRNENTSCIRMRPKDADCLGLGKNRTCQLWYDSDYFFVNGTRYQRYIPKLGDMVVGICTDKYVITNHRSICRVVRINDTLGEEDIVVEVLKDRDELRHDYPTFAVDSILFRLATEIELTELEELRR